MAAKWNVDVLLDKYAANREEVIKSFEEFKDTVNLIQSRVLSVDKHCVCQMGKGDLNSKTWCVNCNELGRLTNLVRNPRQIKLEFGSKTGQILQITDEFMPIFGVKWGQRTQERVKNLDKLHAKLSTCGLSRPSVADRYLCSGNWTNEVIVNWCVWDIFQRVKGVPNPINPFLHFFVCQDFGYKVRHDMGETDFLDYFEGNTLTEDDAIEILKQLVIILVVLKEFQFVHGTATLDKLKIVPERTKYSFRGLRVNSRFRLLMDGLHLSSITLSTENGSTRIMPKKHGRHVDLETAIANFHPIVNSYKISTTQNVCGSSDEEIEVCSTSEGSNLIFNSGGSHATLFTTMRYSGYPLFGGAFDTYSFFVSLLSWKKFGEIYRESFKLQSLWSDLFPDPTEVPDIRLDPEPITCSYIVSGVLKDKWMYCNACDYLLTLLKNLK